MGAVGFIAGLWAEKFDHMATVTNFLIVPLSFLSGTFYSIDRLPSALHKISELNPFFYMIDGFRYGFIGTSDGSIIYGIIIFNYSIFCHLVYYLSIYTKGDTKLNFNSYELSTGNLRKEKYFFFKRQRMLSL